MVSSDPNDISAENHGIPKSRPFAIFTIMFSVAICIAAGIYIGTGFNQDEEEALSDNDLTLYEANGNDPDVVISLPGMADPLEFGGAPVEEATEATIAMQMKAEQTGNFYAPTIQPSASSTRPAGQQQSNYTGQNIFSADVYDAADEKIGTIYDILVNPETGEATKIVFKSQAGYASSRLSALDLGDVIRQKDNGETWAKLTQSQIGQKAKFSYTDEILTNYISLRALQDSDVTDQDGNKIGTVNSIIYDDAEIKEIYFTILDQDLARVFPQYKLDISHLDIVKSQDGYDVTLKDFQTEALQ